MVELVLKPEMFTNNKFMFIYGDREALFTIVDEEFAGNNHLGKINRITVLVSKPGKTANRQEAAFGTTVIGFADGMIGIRSDAPGLKGKLLNKDNMEQCVVELYEDE